jgi:CMP/dCMP kinase
VNISASLECETDQIPRSDALVVAIDGPSGVGKSSTSRGVATTLGLRYLDTGATYRALTWWLLERGVDVGDAAAVAANVATPRIEVGTDPAGPWTKVDGTDVSAAIRGPEVTAAVSSVASVPAVRAHLIAMQQAIIAGSAASGGIVADGRDIGTVVAPEAAVKVFLTASAAARASRRGLQASQAADVTLGQLVQRDGKDAAQSAMADGAVLIDSTSLSLPQVIDKIVALATAARVRGVPRD